VTLAVIIVCRADDVDGVEERAWISGFEEKRRTMLRITWESSGSWVFHILDFVNRILARTK